MTTLETFFLVINPGLEDLAQMELNEKTSIYGIEIFSQKITRGGIELELKLNDGLYLNQLLKIPTRILLRIHQSKVRDFPRLFKKIKNLPLNRYLNGGKPKIVASSIESRLIHSDRIIETANDSIKRYYVENAIKKRFLEFKDKDLEKTLYLRIFQDELTVSIDTSGEALYKRNQLTYRAPGALRENYAAALFYEFINKIKTPVRSLFDPFAGSGTILKEAQNFYKLNQREFIFKYLPIAENIKLITEISKEANLTLKGQEIDSDVYHKSQSFLKGIEYKNTDSFKEKEQQEFILTNLPYGKQVDSLKQPLNETILKLYQSYEFNYLGVLHPERVKQDKKFEVISQRSFSNNSIKVYFTIIKSL